MRRTFLRLFYAAVITLGIGGALVPLTSAHSATTTISASSQMVRIIKPLDNCNGAPGGC